MPYTPVAPADYSTTADDAWAYSLDGFGYDTGNTDDYPGGWTAVAEPVENEFWLLHSDTYGNRTAVAMSADDAEAAFELAEEAYVLWLERDEP